MQTLKTSEVIKIAITGLPGVGKTTITNLLTNRKIPLKHDPTIGVNFSNIKLDELNTILSVFDFAGQERFSFIIDDLIKGSKIILLVTDSTPQNILNSIPLLNKLKIIAPNSKIIGIANKQDIKGALSPERVANILGLETYGMIAIDSREKVHMYRVLINALKSIN
ncbi:MAG: GTP-binding protein [Candidatus Odinarchaeum yellowstonii]|uniref:GTP-binding protein n=1 Tax=Odinarchaeota yellowstonii (strain LCB_4) TaxID=1841599 RepID=A0AAF0IAK5_ODILC|nr:MAG: GTP-binding protein [Candidatus Odinarchaeum yellowstonii]